VEFDYEKWAQVYPVFAYPGGAIPVSDAQAGVYFVQATMLHANDGSGPVCNPLQQSVLLNAVVAHLAAINSPPAGQVEASAIVGRISSASEGSVSVVTENTYPPGTAQYWQQTKYGSFYWEATKSFRRAQYKPNPRSGANPYLPGWGYGSGDGSGWTG
jgi:hypothetical protein